MRSDPEIVAFADRTDVVLGIAGGAHALAVRFAPGQIELVDPAAADAVMRAPEEAWDACLQGSPAPPCHHFLAMRMRVPGTEISGRELAFAQNSTLARRWVELARQTLNGPPTIAPDPSIDRSMIRGRYLRVGLRGTDIDLHIEESDAPSDAPVLLVLHTAGSDGRQAHPIMTDDAITRRYRVVTFDLPGHGRSSRLPHVFGEWSLSHHLYTESITAVINGLDLKRPVLVGASMAGEACLAMAHVAPDRIGGVIACEAADYVPGRVTTWHRDPGVNAMAFTPEWIDGLIGPDAPASQRADIRWHYSQGGFGIMPGDIDFYSGGWDGRKIISEIDTRICPVVMITGEFDYSCTPDMSEATAARIPGAHYWTMPGLGLFPIVENPAAFLPHLQRALDLIDRSDPQPRPM